MPWGDLLASTMETAADWRTWAEDSNTNRDTLLAELANQATAVIEGHIKNHVMERTVTSEIHDGDGSTKLLTGFYPIASVTNIKQASTGDSRTTVTASDYTIDGKYGPAGIVRMILGFSTFVLGIANVEITYVAGLASTRALLRDAHPDILQVHRELVRSADKEIRNRDQADVASVSLEGQTVTLREPGLSTEQKRILEPYVTTRLGARA